MRKRNLITGAALLLVCWAAAGLADEGDAFVEGSATMGARYTGTSGNPQRVGEYLNLDVTEDFVAELYADILGGTSNTLYRADFLYKDSATKSMNFSLMTKDYVTAEFGYDSFIHNLDHDLMNNLQVKAGGKQVYNTDTDPMGRYFLQYEKFHGQVQVDLPGLPGGKVTLGYKDQRKSGYKQTLTIDHCAFCHVESSPQRIDRQTETWLAGIEGTADQASFKYDFVRTEYTDHAGASEHYWKSAIHPLNAGAYDFSSRQIFSDVALPYARSADTEKYSHNLAMKLDLDESGVLKGSYTLTNNRNWWTGVEGDFTAGALGYAVKLNAKTRLTAKFLTYETKVDDYFIDLPNFRALDTTTGNLDFDWNRISSANRKVYQGDVNLGYKVAKGRHLKASLRYQSIDRDAMAQTQTSYLFDDVLAAEDYALLVPSEPFANKTTITRAKLRYDARMGMKGNYNLTYTYTKVDKPFMNPTALCEESLLGLNSASGGDGRIYYFQRQRLGMGSSQPNQSQNLAARASYQVSPRFSFNAFVTYAKDKNDELNIYEFERDMFSPGVNLWTAPSDKVLFTLGWSYSKLKSSAVLCPPIFDG